MQVLCFNIKVASNVAGSDTVASVSGTVVNGSVVSGVALETIPVSVTIASVEDFIGCSSCFVSGREMRDGTEEMKLKLADTPLELDGTLKSEPTARIFAALDLVIRWFGGATAGGSPNVNVMVSCSGKVSLNQDDEEDAAEMGSANSNLSSSSSSDRSSPATVVTPSC